MRHANTVVTADDPAYENSADEWNAAHITPLGNGGAEVTAASYTFVAADAGRATYFNSASAQAAVVPTNAAVPYPIGAELPMAQWGAGTVTVQGDTGVTVNALSGDLTLGGQYSGRVAHKKDTDVWMLW